jgi:hypothetical protein
MLSGISFLEPRVSREKFGVAYLLLPRCPVKRKRLTNCMVYRGSEEAAPRDAAILSIIRMRNYFEMPYQPAVEIFQFAACGGDVAILKAGGVCFSSTDQ